MQHAEQSNGDDSRFDILASLIVEAGEFLNGRQVTRDQAERQALSWRRMLRNVPTDGLRDCFERWQESGPRQGLRALDLLDAFRADRDLKAKLWERQIAEQPIPQFTADGVQGYRCPLCQDSGYCVVWQWGRRPGYFNSVGVIETGPLTKGWLCVRRPCACPATPEAQKLRPLFAEEWVHNKRICQFARISDLMGHGAPTKEWKAIVDGMVAEAGPHPNDSPLLAFAEDSGLPPLPF